MSTTQDKQPALSGARVAALKGTVQHYAWGGYQYLPELLSVPNTGNKPFAEYWLGAHENAPSEVIFGTVATAGAGNAAIEIRDATAETGARIGAGSRDAKTGTDDVKVSGDIGAAVGTGTGAVSGLVRLSDYLRERPGLLGRYTKERFGRLPYLLKILDVKDMLSIQVHPSKASAELGFAEENKKGIAVNAANRNYKDDNHKPELMVALSEFWLLHGFKPAGELERVFRTVPELQFLGPVFKKEGYQGLYRAVMEMEQARVNQLLQPLLDRIVPAYEAGSLDRKQEDFWAARAALTFNEPGRIDRGIFSIYLFNLLNLHPGEAIFQDAGLPHAYLEGQNVEIMANSDNVLRGGLTPKYIDVPELLKHVVFEETIPNIIRDGGNDASVTPYVTPAPDFELARIRLHKNDRLNLVSNGVGIYIVLKGQLIVEESAAGPGADKGAEADKGPGADKMNFTASGRNAIAAFERKKGDAFIAFDEAKLSLLASEETELYWASVPMKG